MQNFVSKLRRSPVTKGNSGVEFVSMLSPDIPPFVSTLEIDDIHHIIFEYVGGRDASLLRISKALRYILLNRPTTVKLKVMWKRDQEQSSAIALPSPLQRLSQTFPRMFNALHFTDSTITSGCNALRRLYSKLSHVKQTRLEIVLGAHWRVRLVFANASGAPLLSNHGETVAQLIECCKPAVTYLEVIHCMLNFSPAHLHGLAIDGETNDSSNCLEISSIGNFTSLHTLNIRTDHIAGLGSLGNCSSLNTLDLRCTWVVDISALGRCKSLHALYLGRTWVNDVSALGNCPSLHTLDLYRTRVVSVEGLGNCKLLNTLRLDFTKIHDISELSKCVALETLDLRGTRVTDVSPLASCTSLRLLNISYTKINDLSGLTGLTNLKVVGCNTTLTAI